MSLTKDDMKPTFNIVSTSTYKDFQKALPTSIRTPFLHPKTSYKRNKATRDVSKRSYNHSSTHTSVSPYLRPDQR